MAEYVAGVCNIGKWNRTVRAAGGIVLLIITLVAWQWMSDNVPRIFRIGLVVPLYAAFVGLYQAYFAFCVYHASRHTYDLR